jgi:hypothetical protein
MYDMLLHEVDEFVELDDAGVVFVDLLHDLLDALGGVFEAEGAHQVGQLGLVDVLGEADGYVGMVGIEDLEGLPEDVLLLWGEAFALFSVAFFAWFHGNVYFRFIEIF